MSYQDIAAALRAEIKDGAHRERLPSEAQLRQRFGVARETVRRALRILHSEGLIFPRQGQGWTIRQDSTAMPGPQYLIILEDLRQELPYLPHGSRLPSEPELALKYSCARGTVRRAMRELEVLGLVTVKPGVGRIVA